MRFKLHGNKADHLLVTIRNSDTVTIKQGSPVFCDPTQSGLEVVSAESLPDAKRPFFFGLAAQDMLVGDVLESVVYGFFRNTRLLLNSRSASSVSWADNTEAHVIGEQLDFDTSPGNQCFVPNGTVPQATLPNVYLAQTLASVAGLASATSDTRTASTGWVKTFVKMM